MFVKRDFYPPPVPRSPLPGERVAIEPREWLRYGALLLALLLMAQWASSAIGGGLPFTIGVWGSGVILVGLVSSVYLNLEFRWITPVGVTLLLTLYGTCAMWRVYFY